MENGTFKRMFQSHLDPDEILTESKWSSIQCNTVQYLALSISLEASSQYLFTNIFIYIYVHQMWKWMLYTFGKY